MNIRKVFNLLLIFASPALLSGWDARATAQEHVTNPRFAVGDAETPAKAWNAWEPVWQEAACRIQRADGGLLIDAPDDPFAVGGVVQEIDGIKPQQAYAIAAVSQLRDVRAPFHSLLVRVGWTKAGKLLHPAGVLVKGPLVEGDKARFSDVLVAPPGADGARLSLEAKWLGKGAVLWESVSMRPAASPAPRKVRIGTVFLRPKNSTPQKNLDLWCRQIDAAGQLHLDALCLGEAMTMVGTGQNVKDVAEPIPGPATKRLAQAARRNSIWLIAGLTERQGDIVYNTAVLFDRQGQIAGKYRKVHLPREEWKQGVRPGHAYPVFETDFGTVAIQICYDWFFPESTAIFALKGAEVIFAPTWGNTLPDQDGKVDGESTFRVRARDNAVYMVPSVYSGNSLVIDPMGRMLASSNGKTGVFWAEVDLSERESLTWVGHWGSIGPRHRMPVTYGPLGLE